MEISPAIDQAPLLVGQAAAYPDVVQALGYLGDIDRSAIIHASEPHPLHPAAEQIVLHETNPDLPV